MTAFRRCIDRHLEETQEISDEFLFVDKNTGKFLSANLKLVIEYPDAVLMTRAEAFELMSDANNSIFRKDAIDLTVVSVADYQAGNYELT